MFYNCLDCFALRNPSEVVILDCKHAFCLNCMETYLLQHMKKGIKCPIEDCNQIIQYDSLKKTLSDEDLKNYDIICLTGLPGVFKCLLPECGNITRYFLNVSSFICGNCTLWNCVPCQASHRYVSCEAYIAYDQDKASEMCQIAMTKARTFILEKTRHSLLMAMKQDLFINDRVFQCILCLHCIGKGEGIKLRTCSHNICRKCIVQYVNASQDIPIKCPNGYCDCHIEDRELNCILTEEEFYFYQRKCINWTKNKFTNGYQCRQPNCDYFCELLDLKTKKFKCPKCSSNNCLKCKAVHNGVSCKQYQMSFIKNDSDIEKRIKEGNLMRCPGCRNLINKSHGCNWIKCCQCGLELCWMLKMTRWGPKGPGDISGGCKCGVNGYCHPKCIGCFPDP